MVTSATVAFPLDRALFEFRSRCCRLAFLSFWSCWLSFRQAVGLFWLYPLCCWRYSLTCWTISTVSVGFLFSSQTQVDLCNILKYYSLTTCSTTCLSIWASLLSGCLRLCQGRLLPSASIWLLSSFPGGRPLDAFVRNLLSPAVWPCLLLAISQIEPVFTS